jgi:predicted unusual protein kinase regulating ubiquinone biosynthesis (AarF/ABC1/UbiB family)
MAINLTLNDFRSVLGKVNDGNVVLKQDQSGIEKANYGSKILNFLRTVRTAENNPQENIQVRQSLLAAIHNSAEGKILSIDDMERIYAALGMPDGSDAASFAAPLSRRELKNVIDIIDSATKNDALVKEDVDALDEKGLLDEKVSTGVQKAMDKAGCFSLSANLKARTAEMGRLFGADFKGRSPAELEKFVRQNMAVIREQVFDRLYWSNPSLKDFSEGDFNELDERFIEYEDDVQVEEAAVTDAFKEVVGELMEKFASKTLVTTRVETIAPDPGEVEPLDDGAKSIWKNNVGGPKFTLTVSRAFNALAEKTGVYAALQLERAAAAVNNTIMAEFNRLYTENGFNAQRTETAFKERMAPLMSVLNAFVGDLERLGPDEAAKVMVKMADTLGAAMVGKNVESAGLADAALTALNETSKGFSARGMVEEFVNANFAYVEDKTPVISFFMEKIGAAGKEGGITGPQATALANTQKAALGGALGAEVKRDLEIALLNPLKEAYNKMVESKDPAKVRALRQQRNEKAFQALSATIPGYAKLSDVEKSNALIKLKVSTLLGKYSDVELTAKGIIPEPGSESIRSKFENDVQVPLQDALEKLDAELCDMDDRDFEFFSHYAAKGMRGADRDVKNFCTVFNQGQHDTVFKDALRDGTIAISSVPKKAVPILQSLVLAQVYAPLADDQTSAVRDMLTREDMSSPLEASILKRMQQRFAATGIKSVPNRLRPLDNPADLGEAGRRLQSSGRGDITQLRGFGTFDPARILNLFAEMGIDLAALEGNDEKAKVDVYEKVLCLSNIAAMSGFKLDGLAEFTERVIGKPFKDVTLTDVFNKLNDNKLVTGNGLRTNIVVADPLDKLSGAQKTAKDIFSGTVALSEVKLSPQETTALLKTARDLASAVPGTVKTASVKVGGSDVEMTRLAGGGLSVKVGNLPMRAVFDAHGLVRMIENEIATKPDNFAPDVVKSALPSMDDVRSGAVPLVRAREIFAKTAAAKTGTLPVMFSAYTTEQLREIAVKAVDGKFTANDIPKNPPASYNSGAMIEMHNNLAKTSSAEVDASVKIAAPAPRSIEERRAIAPNDETVRNIVADLFLNKDTWEFDAGASGKAQPGERVRKLLVEHAPELDFILKGLDKEGDDLLCYVPEEVRGAVREIFAEIKKLDISKLANPNALPNGARDALAAIETKIDGAATQLVTAMQAKVTALFEPHGAGDAKSDWQKTFAELNGKEGIDETTRQGKFTLNVLRNYFTRAAQVDKRAMLSALIRNTEAGSTDAKQVAELLKGAGPLLQKMLQGLPLSSFDPDTQLALKDMKSRLLPIPEEAVKAQMLELVRSSNGNILSIEVKRSLGAASVGQAFLCNIKTKAHPYIGEECVIKLLRPNVDTAIQREKAIIDQIIGDDPAMKATFDGQYRKILEEFDLTLESTNVGIGVAIYERPKGEEAVHTMQMLDGVQSTMTSMILKKADGITFDSAIEQTRRDAEDILAPLRSETEVDGVKKTVYKAPDAETCVLARRQLVFKAAQLNARRNQILKVAKAWFENALFGNGFFHGDLHGGNLMTGPTGITFIDFGNCSRLSPAEQQAMKMMLAAVVSGDTDHVISNFKNLMSGDAKRLFDQKFTQDPAAMKQLTDVLKRGTSLDLMPRVQAFLSIVQGKDVPVPASLQNFVQSYVRLCDIAADIDRTVADIEIAANAIYHDIPEAAPVEGEPKTFSLLKAFVRTYVGDANTPFSAEALRSASDDFIAYASSAAGKEEIKSLTHDLDRIGKELKPMLTTLHEAIRVYGRQDSEPTKDGVRHSADLIEVLSVIKKIERLESAGKIQGGVVQSDNKDEREVFDKLERELGDCTRTMASTFGKRMSAVDSSGNSTFDNMDVKVDESVTDVCIDVIKGHAIELGISAALEYGFFVGGFKNRLAEAFTNGTEMQLRMKNVGPVLAERNRKLAPGERLSGQEMATLSRATSTFLVPSPRPDAEKDWGSNAGKRADMLTAISYNISRAAAAMNLKEGEKLSNVALRHAVLNMGLVDGKLVESIASMSDDDYNALLAEAGQMDAKDGVYGVSSAVSALRGAQAILNQIEIVEDDE